MKFRKLTMAGLVAVCAIALTGVSCDSDGEWGRISLAVTDAPIDSAQRVVVVFTGVEIQNSDGGREVFELVQPRSIDLLALQGGGSEALITDRLLPAGDYEWIRLLVTTGPDQNVSFVEFEDGSRRSIFIPSGDQTGLKLVHGFTVAQDGVVDFTIDFDLRRAIVAPPGLAPTVILRPALRIVDNTRVGAIAGTVDVSLVPTDCTPAVYVYAGAGVTPTDVQPDGGPLASAIVEMNIDGEFVYRVAFLEAGDYTAAFTCGAGVDDPEAVDAITFTGGPTDATVTAGMTTTVDFP